jgi:hypothetical protein
MKKLKNKNNQLLLQTTKANQISSNNHVDEQENSSYNGKFRSYFNKL